ncbi:uncharacterized protein K452DRAFT_298254 [Aplosporella prunicola CBS 121167]|uniref:Uncharacterized protein n=1 Tax=Aplosporella prunicola CBS 121167 TaxID=1176127 RepID=A0A6A6BBF7_9PEZI|nr:uncharacterized protein K452DRAFT_298254 [Aplosporella prunicola CBS 121167]KAF2141539.1 hypothetical protein K452DRAFT_298254 [Aplosporella prunicola CBS 121167]
MRAATLLLTAATALASTVVAKNGSPFNYEKARWENSRHCLVYDPPNHDASIHDCLGVCGDAYKKKAEAGDMASIGCVGVDVHYEVEPGTKLKVAQGNCSCNNAFLNEIAETVIEALPAIAEIGCELTMSALSVVLEVGEAIVPEVGETLDAGMIAGVEAAKVIEKAYGTGKKAVEQYQSWLNPCGDTSAVPDDVQKIFDVMNSFDCNMIPGKCKNNVKKGKRSEVGFGA